MVTTFKLVYVAGPYRGSTPDDVDLNIASATQVGKLVARLGYYPVIPHLNTLHFERFAGLPDQFFLDGTIELMRRCDAVIMCPGWQASSGARQELEEAHRLAIPVFYDAYEMSRNFPFGS